MAPRTAIGLGLLMLLTSACTGERRVKLTDLVRNADDQVHLVSGGRLRTGEPSRLLFDVARDGRSVKLEQERKMFHVILVSADLRDLFHTPSAHRIADGRYEVVHSFTRPGRYRTWVEIDDTKAPSRHGERADLIASRDIVVEGPSLTPVVPLTHGASAIVDGYTVFMEPSTLRSGVPTQLHLAVQDAEGRKIPLPEHDPVLYAMTSDDLSFFSHGHFNGDSDGHAVSPTIVFPTAGRYALLAQVRFIDRGTPHVLEVHTLLTVSKSP